MHWLGSSALVFLYCSSCVCLGGLLFRLMAAETQDRRVVSAPASFVTALLIGQGILAGLWQLIGVAGQFSPTIVGATLLICLVVGAKAGWELSRTMMNEVVAEMSSFGREPWVARILFWACLVLFAYQGVRSLISLPQPHGDAMAFYLTLPKVMAASHELRPSPGGYEAFTDIGLHGELHFAALMSLGAGTSAKAFSYISFLVGSVLLLATGSLVGLKRSGMALLLAMILSSSAVTYLVWDGKVDLFGAALGLSSVYWALQIGGLRGNSAIRLSGFFAGLAVIAKISLLVCLIPPLILLILWRSYSNSDRLLFSWENLRAAAKTLLIFGLWALPAVIPHLVKNAALFGEPLAPFFYLSGQASSLLDQAWFSPETTRHIVLTYPFVMVFGRYPMQYGTLSPLVLAFAPLAFLTARSQDWRRSALLQVGLVATLGLVLWVVVRPSAPAPRYILPTLLLFAVCSASFAESALRQYTNAKLFRITLWSTAYAVLTITTLATSADLKSIERALKEPQFEGDSPIVRAVQLVNREASPGDRVFLGWWYSYHLRPDLLQTLQSPHEKLLFYSTHGFLPQQLFERGSGDMTGLARLEETYQQGAWSFLFDRGFKYVMIDTMYSRGLAEFLGMTGTITKGTPDWLKVENIQGVPDWLQVEHVFEEGNFSVFRLESKDPSRKSQYVGRQVKPPKWQVDER